MARKIRFFEKEKGGREAFLSPRASNAQSRQLFSPNHRNYPRPLPSYRKYHE